MTDREINCVERVERKVDTLADCVNTLTVTVERSLQREEDRETTFSAMGADVWGIQGDPSRPGLKGQQRDIIGRVDAHDLRFKEIEEKHKGGLSKLWMLIVALIGAIVGAVAKHYMP